MASEVEIARNLSPPLREALHAEDSPTTFKIANEMVALGLWERCGCDEDHNPAFMLTALGRRVASVLGDAK